MSSIQKVAIAGANGALGEHVLKQLLDAGFEVVALSRALGKVPRLPHLTEVQVDYNNHASLVSALKGQDAVVATLGNNTGKAQIALVDAAAEVGVKRFIPSDFGSDLTRPELRALPVYREKLQIQEHLIQKAKETSLTYTFVNNNAFLDWTLEKKFTADPVEHKATLWDGGEHLITFTSLDTVGKGVVGVLKHLDETKNRSVFIQEVALSLKKYVQVLQEIAPGHQWTTSVASTAETKDKGLEALSKGIFEPWVFMGQIFYAAVSNNDWVHFKKNDNQLLGIKELNDDELKSTLKEVLAGIPGAI